jgi:hypothetical protein
VVCATTASTPALPFKFKFAPLCCTAPIDHDRNFHPILATGLCEHHVSTHGAHRAHQTMKRTRQNPAMPGTVIDHRGITLSAGVAAFDEALVKDTAKDPNDTAQSQSDACGEVGPVIGSAVVELRVPQLYQQSDDDNSA